MKSVQRRSYFWSVFSHIRTEYGEIRFLRTRNNSVFGHFSRRLIYPILMWPRSEGIDITLKHIVYNILINEWEFKFVYQQNFQLGKKLAVVFFWPKCFYRVSLLMYVKWEKVKMGERDMISLKDQNIGLSIILQVQNEKRAIDLYSGKEIFIR